MTRYRHLLSPITVNGRTFKNRVFSSAHAPGYAEGGMPGERYQAYHEEKAKGGIGLTVFGGSSNVSRDSGSVYGQIYVGHNAIIPVFRKFAERIHKHGAGIMCQITHMGRRTVWDSGDWLPTKGPSMVRDPAHHSSPYALSTGEIRRITKAFADAARRCREGGLDGIEILATTHLLGQFLSPLSNTRSDDYGGVLENRTRFLFEVLEACREATGDDFIIGTRFAPSEENEDGLPQDEGFEIARMLGRHGTSDFLNVNGAYSGTDMGLAEAYPGMAFGSAPYVELARRVREASGLPTFQAARLSDPATADWAVENGYVDMAGMTRPHMADPHIVGKLERDEEDRIRPCVGAGYCIDRVYGGRDALCAHNVSTSREMTLPHDVPSSPSTGTAVVVGGGPAGMEAARILALRGHRVALFEATAKLGGQIPIAAKAGWRKDIIGIADWLTNELGRLGVEVHLNHYAEVADVLALEPETVIIATGGVPHTDLDEGGGELAVTSWDYLNGQVTASGVVLVCDETGSHPALSVANKLIDEGRDVIFATSDRQPGRALGGANYPVYMRNLYRADVQFLDDHRLVGITKAGNRSIARLRNTFSRDVREETVDTIVIDRGTMPVTVLFDELVQGSRNLGETDHEALVKCDPQPIDTNPTGAYVLFRVGDALAGRDIHAALLDSNRLCRAI